MLIKFMCKRVFYGNLVDITQMTLEDADADILDVVLIVVKISVHGIGDIHIAIAVHQTAAHLMVDHGVVTLVMTADGSIIGTIKLSPIMALIAGRRIHLKYLSLKVQA
jgi:hypothetical protein